MKNNSPKPKHIKSFWGIVLIFVVGMVAGGIVYSVAFNNMLQDDISSMTFLRHKEDKSPKKATTSPVNKASTTQKYTK